MSNNIETRSGGIGLSGALFIAFLVLKLTGTIQWSWVWVCAPLWIPFLILLPILLAVALFYVSKEVDFSSLKEKRRAKKLRKSFAKHDIDFDKFSTEMDKVITTNWDWDLDITPDKSTKKSIRRHREKAQRDTFSWKSWWKDGCKGDTLFQKVGKWYRNGNNKSKEKKAAKSEKNS